MEVVELSITLIYNVGVGIATPERMMKAAHDPEAKADLKKLVDEGNYFVSWEGREG